MMFYFLKKFDIINLERGVMKKEYIIVGVIVVAIIGLFIFLRKKEALKVEIKDVISLHFSYTKGYMMNANIDYEFYYDKETSKYMVSVKPHLIAEEDKVIKEAPEGFRDKIKEILIKYDVNKWNGFKKYAKDVLDGDNFYFHVRMEDEQEIEADGYMMWPDNYRLVRDEFDKLFMEIYNKEKGIKENE